MKARFFSAGLILAAMLLIFPTHALAISYAEVTINSLLFQENGISIDWHEKSSQSSAWPTLGTHWDMAYDFSPPLDWAATSAGEQYAYAGATAETRTGDIDFMYSHTWISNQYTGNDVSNVDTQIDRFGFFNVTGNGTLAVTANYSIELYLENEGDFESIMSRGVVYADLALHDSFGNTWDKVTDNQWGGVSTLFDGYGLYQFQGTLHVEHAYSDGDQGMFNISGQSATRGINPVPEPTTMLLLGTGLLSLAGVRRRVKS